MKRLAFTICLNAAHHLLHNNYADYLLTDVLDYWVISEGAVMSGSSPYCIGDNSEYQINGRSIDTTNEILDGLKARFPDKLTILRRAGLWSSKTEMVNAALDAICEKYPEGWLWQIDADEQWTLSDMQCNEQYLLNNNARIGDAKFYQYVGKDIIAIGDNWGGNSMSRLWNWHGEKCITHEPPVMDIHGKTVLMPQKFHHYSYVHDCDVKFKSNWYGYGDEFYERWKTLQTQTEFPRPLSELFTGWEGVGGRIVKIG